MPPKKPLFLRRPAAREVEGKTVVPNPIPQEELRRRVPFEPMRPPQADPPHAEMVPGQAATLEEVTVQGETVEMIEGVPQRIPALFKKPVTPSSWPIHLTAQVLLNPTQNGAPNFQALRAPQGSWMRIDEIKFSVALLMSDYPGLVLSQMMLGFGAVVGASFSLAGKQVTAGFVPVSMFGVSRKLSAERGAFNEPGGSPAREWSHVEEYCWPLSVPIYVPPGAVLEPVFEHRGFLDYATHVTVSYSGVVLNDPPSIAERSKLPFASAWVSQALTLDGGHNLANSTEKDLVGPTGADFNVEYLMGRVYVACQTNTLGVVRTLAENDFDTGHILVAVGNGDVISNQAEVRLRGSWGTAMVPDYKLFPAVFDRVSRQVLAPHVMPAAGYCLVGIRSNATRADASLLALVSMVGWQEVSP